MSEEQEDWAKWWEAYRRRKVERAERDAYEAGYRIGALSAQQKIDPVGTLGWALRQALAGHWVARRGAPGRIFGPLMVATPFVTVALSDIRATDWEIVEGPGDPCDSPCDSP